MHQGACKQEQARPTATAYSCLPQQIYRLLAQCKDYQRELCGPALALSRFIDLLLFQIQNVHSSGKQDILGLWVPSMERRRCVCSQSPSLIKLEGVGGPLGAGEFPSRPTVTQREETWSTRSQRLSQISTFKKKRKKERKKKAVDANWILIVCVFLAAVGIRSRRSHQFCLPLTPLVIVRRRHMFWCLRSLQEMVEMHFGSGRKRSPGGLLEETGAAVVSHH